MADKKNIMPRPLTLAVLSDRAEMSSSGSGQSLSSLLPIFTGSSLLMQSALLGWFGFDLAKALWQ